MTAKKIIVGVTGSIAAYKSLLLVRLLVKMGNEVRVVMTPAACEFVSALSFATLSKHKVHVELIDNDNWADHVSLGLWADAMVIAPATASTMSKMAAGLSDNMLVATYLSAKCPVFIAPAMDLDMWKHPATKHNLQQLVNFGHHIIPVGHGELASGLVGEGRMAEPHEIFDYLQHVLDQPLDYTDQHVLITAGPTREAIDPVRYISNRSTGTMGVELALAVAGRGGHATLVLGPTDHHMDHPRITVIDVVSAQEMYDACANVHDDVDICVFAAAVADYTPAFVGDKKLKKSDDDLSIPLRRTFDIAKRLGERKRMHQIHVGFALETNNGVAHAQGKLAKKNFDLIVLNTLEDKGAGFGKTTNKVSILSPDNTPIHYPVKPKNEVAHDILDAILSIG